MNMQKFYKRNRLLGVSDLNYASVCFISMQVSRSIIRY
jgi:hypothetical protein